MKMRRVFEMTICVTNSSEIGNMEKQIYLRLNIDNLLIRVT